MCFNNSQYCQYCEIIPPKDKDHWLLCSSSFLSSLCFFPTMFSYINYVSKLDFFFFGLDLWSSFLIKINSSNTLLWGFTRKSLHCHFSYPRPVKMTYKFIHVQFVCLSFLMKKIDCESQLNMAKPFLRWWHNR